ncbi:hypothetical protein CJ030_MR7G017735 [Morella rubra]|uniref:Uncharacterized protein n=1 Tax=Morella rubra TaxID=262757 RepID=A0A6A1V4L4_9ROSI|nr:hypothetical protein CJ030_MR7G017735 [Morella rubra]
MSVFGTTRGTICADYFGDELGLPLPPIVKTTKTAAGVALNKSENGVEDFAKRPAGESRPRVFAFAVGLDGLDCFETLVLN